MNDESLIQKGKINLIVIISIILTSDFFIILFSLKTNGLNDLMPGLIRFSLTALILFFLFKGKKWAKILILIIYSIALIYGIILIFKFKNNINMLILMSSMVLLSSTIYFFLLFSKNIKLFLLHQKNK